MIIQILYSIPIALFFIFLFIYILKKHEFVLLIQICTITFILCTIFIKPENRLEYWLPGNTIALYITFFFVFSEFFHNKKFYNSIKIKKIEVKNKILSVNKEKKEEVYFRLVDEIKNRCIIHENSFTRHNSFIMLFILFVVTCICFFYSFYLEISYGYFNKYITTISEQTFEQIKTTQEKYPNLYKNSFGINKEKIDFIFSLILKYSFFISFVINFLILYVISYLQKKIFSIGKPYYYPICSLTNFSLPILFFWIFIVLLSVFWLSYRVQYPIYLDIVVKNLLFTFIFLYIINGYSIIKLYGEIHLVSFHSISIFILIVSFIIQMPFVYATIIAIYLSIGVGDIWFSLRKKALHYKLPL